MTKFLIFLLCLITLNNYAQTYAYKGNQSLGVQFNLTDLGYSGGINYFYYAKKTLYYKFYGAYETSNKFSMKHSSYLASGSLMYLLPVKMEKTFIGIGGGACISYDNLDKDKLLGETFVRDGASFGPVGNIDMQYFLSKRVSALLNFSFNYNPITKFAPSKFWGGIGFNYNF